MGYRSLVVFVVFSCTVLVSESIVFILPANHIKCISDEISRDVLVKGDIHVSDHPGLQVDYVVADSKNNVLSKKDNVRGSVKFSVVTETHEKIEVCFRVKPLVPNRNFISEISLVITRSEGLYKLNGTAEAESLKPFENKLRSLQYVSEYIVKEFALLVQNERLNRNTNESTHFRIFYFSLTSIAILLGLALWQVIYLRRFFKVKKLIE